MVFASIKDMNDVFTACQLATIIQNRFGLVPKLICPWLFSLRCDRQFSEFETEDSTIILCLLDKYFEKITVHCPHSKSGYYSSSDITEISLFSRAAQKIEADTIVLPDEGAANRFDIQSIKTLCQSDSGQDINIVICSKVRDVSTGQLSGFKIESGTVGKRCLIVDDICDGGGEGIRIAEFSRDTKLQDIKNYRGETRKVTSEELLPIIHQGDVRFWTWDGFVGMAQGFAGAEKKFRERISDIKWRLSDMILHGCTQDRVESLLLDIQT